MLFHLKFIIKNIFNCALFLKKGKNQCCGKKNYNPGKEKCCGNHLCNHFSSEKGVFHAKGLFNKLLNYTEQFKK